MLTYFGFIITVIITLYLPGYVLLRILFSRKSYRISHLETLALAFPLSIAILSGLMIGMHLLYIPITWLALASGLLGWLLLCILIESYLKRNNSQATAASLIIQTDFDRLNYFSYRQILAFLLLFGFATLLRTVYVAQGAMPQTTDLGHHMYWAQYIAERHQLPDYHEAIIEVEDTGKFIIGEHLVFGAVTLLSGIPVMSGVPLAILLLIQLHSVLALFLFSYRVIESFLQRIDAKKIAFLVLATNGIFYAVSAPGAKYISGGVIGNVMGNLLVPMLLYCLISGILMATSKHTKQKSTKLPLAKEFAVCSVLIALLLAYTHHLSTFIFLFVVAATICLTVMLGLIAYRFQLKKFIKELYHAFQPLVSVQLLFLIFVGIMVMLFLYPPSYLNVTAINTAVGTPIKDTRIGLPLSQIEQSAGSWRFTFGLIGLATVIIITLVNLLKQLPKFTHPWITHIQQISLIRQSMLHPTIKGIVAVSLNIAWFLVIFVMSYKPSLLRIDVPSNRISNYLTLPTSLLSAIGVYYLLAQTQRSRYRSLSAVMFLVTLGTGMVHGLADVSESARDERRPNEVAQVYAATRYLKQTTAATDIILKDHINLAADSWMKVILMREYKNPLSRSLLKRYDDPTKQRETCTRDMIALPNSDIGKQCFDETNTSFVVLKPGFDTQQFETSSDFSKIYASPQTVIYQRIP